jgi:hypothetical protein
MNPESPRPHVDLIADLPRERRLFKELLLAKHFHPTPPPEGEPPVGDTSYEQLLCIGYQPALQQLNAVVELKLDSGYSGGICTSGSTEYVAFFASTDDGATWTALGTTSFTAWDTGGPKPLLFDVSLPVDLPALCCKDPNLVLIRAILSWEVPPGGPSSPIVWGNGLDAHVQVAPLTLGTFAELWECLELPIELEQLGQVVNLEQIIEFGTNTPLTPVQLHKLYAETKVPQHRYLLGSLMKLLADPVAMAQAADDPDFELVPGLKKEVDLAALIAAVSDPQGNETYEQLGCIGLNPMSDSLVATIDVKLPNGYGGDLCAAGSNEYVAFWADWGSGWEYAGTTAVNTHDIATIPSAGLQYAAVLPFAAALTNRRPCTDGALIIPIRAVLSWGTPPSSSDPYAVPTWGGHLEANVLIPPGQPVSVEGGPELESIGSMPVGLIDQSTGLASGQSIVAFYASDCPFGGVLTFTGHVINTSGGVGGPGLQYRILVSPNNGATSTPLTAPFTVTTDDWSTATQTSVLQTPDASGWTNCLEDYSASIDVVGNVLGYHQTSGNDPLYVQMQVQDSMGNPIGSPTPWIKVQLDNSPPNDVQVAITSGGGSCGDFAPGDLIEGTYSAQDNEHLVAVTIGVEMAMPGATLTQMITTETLTFESGTWRLQTLSTTTPCGYTISATASDNTIVNSGFIGWDSTAFTGLCLRRPAA